MKKTKVSTVLLTFGLSTFAQNLVENNCLRAFQSAYVSGNIDYGEGGSGDSGVLKFTENKKTNKISFS